VIKTAGKANNTACKSTSTNFEFFIFSSPIYVKIFIALPPTIFHANNRVT